jgi:diadenosine tetraphosphate (Ap4A) HIT family hydrolase
MPEDGLGLIPDATYILFEDTDLVALVPEFVRVPGSVAIVSRGNARSIMELSEAEVSALARLLPAVALQIELAFDPQGLNVWWATGHLAGQTEPRALVELVPRYKDVPYQYADSSSLPKANPAARRDIYQALTATKAASPQQQHLVCTDSPATCKNNAVLPTQ